MRNSLVILIVTVVLSVEHSFGRTPCIDEQTNINCTETYVEYENDTTRCKEIFIPCMTQEHSQVSMCDTSKFCSDECRSIYHKVQWCDNTTTGRAFLKKLDLFCATSSDPQHQDSNCLDFSVKAKTSGAPEYGYVANCLRETITELALPCSEICRNSLMSYRNECCSNNLAVAKQARPGEDNESLYSDRLWEHCGVASPQLCPVPACPTSTVPTTATTTTATTTATTTIISEPLTTGELERLGGAPKHQINWFILFITVVILFI